LKRGADTPELIDLYFATANEHKLKEAAAALSPHGVNVNKLEEFEKIEIQHTSLEEIAQAALSLIVPKTGKKLVFVEDSGLFIHELNGFPGPYSSYVFDTLGTQGILKLLDQVKSRKAEFRSAVSIGTNGKILGTFSSTTEGTITLQTRGANGFGFDPIFVPMWANKTFGEMELKEKTVYSHRAKALVKMGLWYLNAAKTKTTEQNAVVVSPLPSADERKKAPRKGQK
jgi:XTP/dITP diphosphohydrolase